MSKEPKILGQFSKGTDGSVSINFGVSGGKYCSTKCRHHPESIRRDATGACYAAKLEARPDRQELTNKLERHQEMPAALVCGRALIELQRLEERGKLPPWCRFLTNGSAPKRSQASPLFVRQFRTLIRWLVERGVPVHLPQESAEGAAFYREIVGDLVTVRESLQAVGAHQTTPHAVSWVAGDDIRTGSGIYERRIDAARTQCQERTAATGRKAIVCPAVVAGFRQRMKNGTKNERAKCGNCTACSLAHIDVCYPMH